MGNEIQQATRFAQELEGLFGDDLAAVVLYGSAARGEYRPGLSDLNVLVLLHTLDADRLRRGSAAAVQWTSAGNPPPLMLSLEEWRRSADVFPIEYSDIIAHHLLLRGSDPFAGIVVDWEHLRLQCEHELKGKQIQLREGYLLGAGDPKRLGALLVRSFSTFLTLFRTTLRLANLPVPRTQAEVIDAVAQRAGFDPACFHEVMRARDAGGSLEVAGDSATATGYLEGVARTAAWLDRLDQSSGSQGEGSR